MERCPERGTSYGWERWGVSVASPAPPTLFCGTWMIPSSGPVYAIRVHVALGQWEGPSPAISLETKHQSPEKGLVAFHKQRP